MRYQELAIRLGEARAFLSPGKDRKPDRKLAFLYGVTSVIQFLQRTKFFAGNGLEESLVNLLYELQTVANGLPSQDFAVKPGARGRGVFYRAFQMDCSLLLESYIAAGLAVGDACSRIVRIMKKPVSPRTIQDWRFDLSSESNGSPEAQRFRQLRDEFSRIILGVREIDAWASRLRVQYATLEVKGQMNRTTKTRIITTR
jgi:hypothetical protein